MKILKTKKIKPDKAYMVLKDGMQVEAEIFVDYLDDEILTHDKHKDGLIHFKSSRRAKIIRDTSVRYRVQSR